MGHVASFSFSLLAQCYLCTNYQFKTAFRRFTIQNKLAGNIKIKC